MSRLDPSVAAIRNAVRAALTGTDQLVLVACSGGADSMALAAATAFVAPRQGWRCGLITVDHRLQAGSDLRAKDLTLWGKAAGFDPCESVEVVVGREGGPEAAAREARYRALVEAARRHGAACVLLGHTEDDQAETVLLALTRGAGPRGLAAMPAARSIEGVTFLRPLLQVSRSRCRKACTAMGLAVWDDPHNTDAAYTRSRVRADLMPALVETLGADVVPNLARSAALIAADSDYLDSVATIALGECSVPEGLSTTRLRELPAVIRMRVLHAWAASLGCPRAALSHRHVEALDHLVMQWHGQGPTQLPGGISVARRGDLLAFDV